MGKYYTNDIEFSSGLGKFIHMITWPIRKFYLIIPVITLAYVTPIFFDVKPNEVPFWYKEKFNELYNKSMENEYVKASADKIGSSAHSVQGWISSESKELTFNDNKPQPQKVMVKGEGNDVLVDMPKAKTTQRKAFDKTSEVVPVEVSGLESAAYSDNSVNVSAVEIMNSETPNLTIGSLSNGIFSIDELINPEKKIPSLVYLKIPKRIIGQAKVMNANELEVAGIYILLYGIYVEPTSDAGQSAAKFLIDRIGSSDVRCNIVAYTSQGVATAVCLVNDINLNKELIQRNLTKNVAF